MNKQCRTCLKYSTKTFPLTNIVTGCSLDITYAQLLKEYAGFEYNNTYECHLPQFLCFLCCSQLKSTYSFIQKAQQSNNRLKNDLTKQLCLQEQVIDLPKVECKSSVSIKETPLDNQVDLEDLDNSNFIANENNRNHTNNLAEDKSFIIEPFLTTDEIIEYDFEDNLVTNKSFIIEPTLTTDQIIEYDFEDSVEMDNGNESNGDNSKEKPSLSNKIESLESVELLLETPLHKEELNVNHIKETFNSNQPTNFEESVEKNVVSDTIIKCRFCDYIAKTKSGLRYHKRTKHGTDDDKFKCKFCSYITSLNKYTLLHHIKNVHKELIKTLKANADNKKDESIDSNNGSDKSCNKNNIISPGDKENSSDNDNDQDREESSDEDFIRNIIHMKKKPSKRLLTKTLVIRCEECGKIYKNYKTLRAHQQYVHKSKDKFSSCPYCDKKCKRESGLKFHIRNTHGPQENKQQPKPRSKEKRFMCAECSYTCTTSTVLNIHIRLHHTGERPYKCDICSKSFVVPHDLKIHRYSHTGEKPYKCSICSKSFRDNTHLLNHKRLHTNEKKTLTCDVCDKNFTQSYNLSVHKRTHLKEKKLICAICGLYFKNKSMLNIHQINENHYDEVV